eukprot:Transcript_7225.p2 GENE.Transcript_7225~~Transcript_7225.p2  ORF type:complete len:179 (-),score=37.49 Transcript_7225:128-616(-)
MPPTPPLPQPSLAEQQYEKAMAEERAARLATLPCLSTPSLSPPATAPLPPTLPPMPAPPPALVAAPAPALPDEPLAAGARVFHEVRGAGTLVALDGNGGAQGGSFDCARGGSGGLAPLPERAEELASTRREARADVRSAACPSAMPAAQPAGHALPPHIMED